MDLCASTPCQNGGVCLQPDEEYACTCMYGFIGINCEIDLDSDSCASSPCVYGTCRNVARGYLCTCLTGWTGQRCHLVTSIGETTQSTSITGSGGSPNRQSSSKELNIGIIIGIVVAAIVGVAIGISLTLFIYCLRRRDDDIVIVATEDKMAPGRPRGSNEGNEFGMRSYESMSSIDDVIPDDTPPVVLTGERYYNESGEYDVNNQTLTQQSLQIHDQRESNTPTTSYRHQEYNVAASTPQNANITLNITQSEQGTEDHNSSNGESTIDNLASRSDTREPYSNIGQPD
ncbi:uncharacterized protein LOC144449266 [Glandiceps talaboti]